MIFAKIVGVKVIWRGEVIPHKQKNYKIYFESNTQSLLIYTYIHVKGIKFFKKPWNNLDKNNFIKCSVDNSFFKGKLKNNKFINQKSLL